ncbi:MAG TPA: acetylglutamate kinase [Candidatus Gastranaerophilales bacterium]|nr:acetylglutamate kinase [Candidatus Gastranaerophilales bacterium]
MQKHIDKAKILVETLPYLRSFRNKIVVIKYGGSAMLNETLKKQVVQDISFMKMAGIFPVIVHGGGPEINNFLNKIQKKSEFVEGLRVTDEETMEVVEMTLSGKINKEISANLQNQGLNAVGISGKDGNLLIAKKKFINGQDVGFIGEVETVNTELIEILIEKDFIPVISPVAREMEGNSYNINADYAASAIAGALKAEKLIFLTDIEGLLKDVNDPSSLISRISVSEAQKLIDDKTISGGMIPKIDCCMEAVKKGVSAVHILDGRIEHSLLLDIFTDKGFGTLVYNDN